MRCSQEVAQNWKENPSAQVKQSGVEGPASVALEEKGWLEKSTPLRGPGGSPARDRGPLLDNWRKCPDSRGRRAGGGGQPLGAYSQGWQILFFATVSRLFWREPRIQNQILPQALGGPACKQ